MGQTSHSVQSMPGSPPRLGEAITRFRVSQGMEISDLAQTLKITCQGLEAIESGTRRAPTSARFFRQVGGGQGNDRGMGRGVDVRARHSPILACSATR